MKRISFTTELPPPPSFVKSSMGSRYTPPAPDALVLPDQGAQGNRYRLVVSGGGINPPFVAEATLSAGQCFTARMPTGQWLLLSVCASNGMFEGFLTVPGLASGMRLDGVVIQSPPSAVGCFRGPERPGTIELTLEPK